MINFKDCLVVHADEMQILSATIKGKSLKTFCKRKNIK